MARTMTIDRAVELAQEDIEFLRDEARGAELADSQMVLDGSMYAPSWRALPGGGEVYDADDDGSLCEAYNEELDRGLEELGLYWEEGCLWR